VLKGDGILPYLPALAGLRMTVFREFPYLYDGDADYEQGYLRTYATSPRAAIIAAFDGDAVVGASTCLPLADETGNVAAPFIAAGLDVRRYFYFGESVLLAPYRGRGIGVRFFEAREAQAAGYDFTTFCAVQRAADDPRRPADYQPLDAFWAKRGYVKQPRLACTMSWKEVGHSEQTSQTLIFWMKPL
jgi:GNAT superfamily N-acetyltransferase